MFFAALQGLARMARFGGVALMIYIEGSATDAAFHFAMEEFCIQHPGFDQPVMLLWQADKCAMLGINQVPEAEVDVALAQAQGNLRCNQIGNTVTNNLNRLLSF